MRKILFSILLLLFAGVQTTKAQQMIVVTKDGDAASFNAQDLECVLFAEAGNYEFVDLGLPSGTLWATCNVGAENPEDYGDYLAWGETKAKESYSWGNYKWMTQGQDGWQYVNKYTFEDGQTNACWYSGSTFVGDGKRELLKGDDAAFMNWGGKCQMPTDKQLEELTNSTYTTQEYTTRNGVKGLKITGKNGKSIFLPASGWVLDTLYGNVEEGGYYWSCAAGPSYSDRASYLFFSYSMAGNAMSNGDRYVGRSVRPVIVRVKEHEYVDLGLPSGTLWATCNVGANSPQEYGYYFAWGETEPKSDYSWSNYKWCKGTDRTMTKYCSESGYGYNGFTDVLVELQPEDDAATANWGSDWQMPSYEQIDELKANTTSEYTTQNGVNGFKITGKNGNSIFLPAAGFCTGTSLNGKGDTGYFWSRWLWSDMPDRAYCIGFDSTYKILLSTKSSREVGRPVRPVRKK